MKKHASLLILGLALVGLPDALDAKSVGRVTQDPLRTKNAPTIEDYADYFKSDNVNADLKKEVEADKLRLKSIAAINEMLEGDKSNSPKKFELLLRLGELYIERHDFLRAAEIETFQKVYDAWQKKQEGKAPEISHEISKREMNKAANSFRTLVNAFPKHPRTDKVLFELAQTLSRLGMDNAVLYYQKILKDHPKSPLVPDTYLALGEHYFDKFQVDEAIENYKKVMTFKEHRAYPYSVYKVGWAYFNKKPNNDQDEKENLAKSIAAFKLVIKLSDKEKRKEGSSKIDLREEAIKDLIMVWAEAEDIESAWAYFKTIGEKDSFYVMLERLGEIYQTHGENAKAIQVYSRLLKEAPLRENNPQVHLKLVEILDLQGNHGLVLAEISKIRELYIGDTAWTKKFPDKKQDASAGIERNFHRYGALFHNRGLKAKSPDHLKTAAKIYAIFLDTFPKNENAYEIRFNLAEIMLEFKQYDAAATHYLIVSKEKPTDGKYSKESATSAVVSMNNLVAEKTYEKLPPLGQVASPMPLPKEKVKLNQALDNYVKNFPKEKDSFPMRFTVAQSFFEYGHYDDAIVRFTKITDEIPETPQADAAAKAVLSFYGGRSDWDNVVKFAKKFEKNEALMKQDKLGAFILDAHKTAAFNTALNLEKTNKFAEAAAAFVAFEAQFKNDKNAERSLYNASVNFFKANDTKKALEVQTHLLKDYPNSSLKADILASLGETYEALVQFKPAAQFYLQLGTEFPKDERAPNALMNSSVLFRGIDDLAAADQALTTFTRDHKGHKLYPFALMSLAEIKEKTGATAAAVANYREFVQNYGAQDKDQGLFAEAKIAELSPNAPAPAAAPTKKGKAAPAAAPSGFPALAAKLAGNQQVVAIDARRLTAKNNFEAILPAHSAFKTMTLNADKLEATIKAMQDELVTLSARYEGVMNLGSGEYVVASLYQLGELHEIFADKLNTAPIPAQASESEINQIRSTLEGLAFPLKEEAYKFYETAFKRSAEVETFSDWTKLTYKKMTELQPAQHPVIDALVTRPTYMSHKISMKDAEQ